MEFNLFYLLCICLSIVVWRLFYDLNGVKNVEKSENVFSQDKFQTEDTFTATGEGSSRSRSWSLKCQVGLDLKARGKLKESSEIFSTLSLSEFLNMDQRKGIKEEDWEFLPQWDECLWEIGVESKSGGDYEKTFQIFSSIYQYQKETKGENHPSALKILDELGRVVLQHKLKEDGNSILKIKSNVNAENKSAETDDEPRKPSLNLLSRSLLWILSIGKTTSWILVYILSFITWMSIPLSTLIGVFHPIHQSRLNIFNFGTKFGSWPFITRFLLTAMAFSISSCYDESLSLKNLHLGETINVQTDVVKYILYFFILNSVVILLAISLSFPIFEALTDLCLVSFADDIKKGVEKGQSFIYTAAQGVILFTFGFLCLATKVLVKEILHSLLLLMTIVLTVFYVFL